MSESNYIKATSPKGTLRFPKLVVPDEFMGKKNFVADLILTQEVAKPFIELLEKTIAADHDRELSAAKDPKARKKIADYRLHPLYSNEEDKDGNETGNVVFKFKTAYQYKNKKGETITSVVRMFDSKGVPVKDVNPWGGTTAKIACDMVCYHSNATEKYGISLRISAVQIIKLVTGSGGADATQYGFASEADGFEAPEVDSFESASSGTGPQGEPTSGDF